MKLNCAILVPLIAFNLSGILLVLKLMGLVYYPRIVWLAPVLLYAALFLAVAVHCIWAKK